MNAPQPAPMLALPNYSALGSIVTPENDNPHSALSDAGWEEVGSGCYCTAYLSPDGSRILKIAYGCGARATVDAALRHPDNPHLPTVYGVLDLEDGGFAVECEPLEHFDDYDPDGYEEHYSATWQAWRDEYLPSDRYRGPQLASLPNGPMKDALAALVKEQKRTGTRWDCHDGNLMLRPSDGTIVLNDLLA